jgi:hypothetical protein
MRTHKTAEKIKCTAGNKRPHGVIVDNLVTRNNIKIIIKQNRTEQNRTEQNRTEKNRTEQNRTGNVTHRKERRTFPGPLRWGTVQSVLQLWHWPVALTFGNLRLFVTKH